MEPRGSHHVRSTHAHPGFSGAREHCWSEGATDTLIEAWGKLRQTNRGHLCQKDWREVADSVNALENGVESKKMDIQCKNRIDTLKKKYKIERAKPPPSKWRFYNRLDSLIGTDAVSKKPTTYTLRVKSKLNASFIGRPVPGENHGLSSDGDDDDDEEGMVVKKVHRMEDVDLSDGAACRELARAIMKFGEIYERIESAKQKQMMEVQKERLKFINDF